MIPASWRIYPGDGMRAIGSYSPGFDAAAYPFSAMSNVAAH